MDLLPYANIGRDIGDSFVDFIQIDAPINRGNSGGPTFDIYGRVIGVNSAIISPSGGSIGIGFAIPADVADRITEQLIAGGKITRGYLGATIQDISSEIAESLGKPGMKGALVDELAPGGPAQRSGVQPGDVILAVDGQAVDGATSLTRLVAATHAGDTLHLSVLRGGKSLSIEVRSGLRPTDAELLRSQGQGGGLGSAPDEGAAAKPDALGLILAPLDSTARSRFGVPDEIKGALVADLASDSDAAAKGVKPGDVVIRVNEKAVSVPADVDAAVAAAKKAGRENVLLFVYHDHHQAAVAVRIAPKKDDDAPAKDN